jgi:hypothetical protein
MITTLQTKYTKTRGTPIVLSKTYNNKLNEYKNNILIVFSLSFIVLMTMFFGYETINIDFYQSIKTLSFIDFYKLLPTILVVISSLSIIGISSYQVYISDMFSKLSKKDLI